MMIIHGKCVFAQHFSDMVPDPTVWINPGLTLATGYEFCPWPLHLKLLLFDG